MLNVQCSTSTYSEKIEKIEKTILCGQRSDSEYLRETEKKSQFFLSLLQKTKAKISRVCTFEHYPKKNIVLISVSLFTVKMFFKKK
jgi:hypothetical protein